MEISFLYLIHNSFSPDWVVGNHVHNCYELSFYKTNSSVINFSHFYTDTSENIEFKASTKNYDGEVVIKPNGLFIVPPFISHMEKYKNGGEIITLGFAIKGADIQSISLKEINLASLNLNYNFQRILEEYKNKKIFFKTIVEDLIKDILITILRETNNSLDNKDFLSSIKLYIDQNLSRTISVEELSIMSRYSPSHFRKVFKEAFGLSPKQYIEAKRKETAKRLLLTTDLSINEISGFVGFTSYYQFAAFYKKVFGISPTEERLLKK